MSANQSWFSVKNLSEESAEVFIYDEIGFFGVGAKDFVRALKELGNKALTVRINSPGGDVFEGSAIYNALLRHKGGVTVQIDGIAASMASVIAMAGKPVKMAANSFLMIHNPSTLCWGESDDMRSSADLLDKIKVTLAQAYADKTGKDSAEIEAMMDAETWLTAQEAFDGGFIDEITDRVPMAACFDLKRFNKAPSALVDSAALDNMSAELKAKLDAEIALRETAQEQAKKNYSDLQAALADLSEIKAKFEAKEQELVAKDAQISDLTEQVKVTNEKVNAEAARMLAASGHAPLNVSIASNDGDKVISRAEFNKLSPQAQANFCRAGGKLTDN